MDAKQGFGTLIEVAADLVHHRFLPSWVAEDYPTKTMSTAKVAQRMGDASEQLKVLAMRVRQGADALIAEVDAKQAKIDALMLEFCPDEMTPEQKENWARRQRRADPSQQNVPQLKVFPAPATRLPPPVATVRCVEAGVWQSVEVKPRLISGWAGVPESKPLLVWIDEPGVTRGFTRGTCVQFPSDKKPRFKADGIEIDWNITHWMYVPAPQEAGVQDASCLTADRNQVLTLTGKAAMDLLGFVAPDCFKVVNQDSEIQFARNTFTEEMECQVCIGRQDFTIGADGEPMPAGLYAWMTEHPEEGMLLIQADGQEVESA